MTSIESKLQALRELGEKANKGPVEFHSNALVGWWEIWSGPLLLAARPPWENRAAESVATGELFASSLTALPKLIEGWDAILRLHAPYGLYDECGHDHKEGEPGVTEIDDVGLCCEEGRTGTICRECHTTDGEVNEDCWDATYPCPTIEALSKLGEGL